MFVGVNKRKGVCYGVIAFDLDGLPDDAKIKSARFSLYPMNRVNAKVENFGEWTVSILAAQEITDLTNFSQIHQAQPMQTLGQAIASDQLTQGIWSEWDFNVTERHLLKKAIKSGKVIFRIEGPKKLPLGADSQIMQFDIGYGKFGAGIHYRPNLEIIYSRAPQEVILPPVALNTINKNTIVEGELCAGLDDDGDIVYGQMAFQLNELPQADKTVITNAYLMMQNKSAVNSQKDTRFTIELAELKYIDYLSVKQRQKKEFIGYEVSSSQLREKNTLHFIFDSYCRQQLEKLHQQNTPCYLIIRATASSKSQSEYIDWHGETEQQTPRLVIEYVERRKNQLPAPTELTTSVENGLVRLNWNTPDDPDFVGCFVVRNRFHPPKSPLDGVKLYGGPDNYTYDNFGNANIAKYYSVFSYDDVPNYSEPASVLYSVTETIAIAEQEYEQQDGEEDINE